MKYVIYGSCVSRDIFSITQSDEAVVDYRARSSIHSYTASPIPDDDIPSLDSMSSKFQRRMVEKDFKKPRLLTKKGVPILIDFIDERFDVLEFRGSLVTASNEFNKHIAGDDRFRKALVRGSKEEHTFRLACKKFNTFHADAQIVLHSSRYAETYERDGEIHHFDYQTKINKMNQRMELYERIFTEELPHARVLRVPIEKTVADSNHKWGLAPFHYIEQYYQYAVVELNRIWNQFEGESFS